MIIGIDARVLGSGRHSGIEEYTENLLARMLPIDTGIQFKIFNTSHRKRFPRYAWLDLKNVQLYDFSISSRFITASSFVCSRPFIDRILGGVDVFFSPHFVLAPVSSECKKVITFHDLSYYYYPDFFSWKRTLWHNIEMRPRSQALLADKLIAVSNSTKDDLVKAYGADPAKIRVIYSGISDKMIRPTMEDLENFRIKNNLPLKFILFLGTLEPRKNILGIIRAFQTISRLKPDTHLVIAGERGWLYREILQGLGSSEATSKIILRDITSSDIRPYLYSLAQVVVFPSFYEGFGFPPLEAIACHVPIVATNRSSVVEIIKNRAILVDPHNISQITRHILRVLDERAYVRDLVSRQNTVSDSLDWQITANRTLEYITK